MHWKTGAKQMMSLRQPSAQRTRSNPQGIMHHEPRPNVTSSFHSSAVLVGTRTASRNEPVGARTWDARALTPAPGPRDSLRVPCERERDCGRGSCERDRARPPRMADCNARVGCASSPAGSAVVRVVSMCSTVASSFPASFPSSASGSAVAAAKSGLGMMRWVTEPAEVWLCVRTSEFESAVRWRRRRSSLRRV